MGVTTQESTEYANIFTTQPAVMNPVSSERGKIQFAFFTHDQSGAGDATSSVALAKLPSGRVKVLLGLSKAYVNWTTGSATLDLGWDAYSDLAGTTVVADPDGLCDGIDVDAVGERTFSTSPGTGIAALGYTKTFLSKTGVVLRATSQDQALASGDDLVGYIAYVCD